MSSSNNPKVFVIHAHEDKEHFVLGFCTNLRSRGIDVWLDHWEILPGDSLIDKIFGEGLSKAQAVIVVLSNNSVNSPWVREELNSSLIKRIQNNTRLLPVVIDNCQVPEALHTVRWQKIQDITNYSAELDQIVAALFEEQSKPPLGEVPAYTKTIIDNLPGLQKLDSQIFQMACRQAIQEDNALIVSTDSLLEEVKTLDIGERTFWDELTILENQNYIKKANVIATNPPYIKITPDGLGAYLRSYYPDYPNLIRKVMFQILNFDIKETLLLRDALQQPRDVINFILRELATQRLVKLVGINEGRLVVNEISPELARVLNSEQ